MNTEIVTIVQTTVLNQMVEYACYVLMNLNLNKYCFVMNDVFLQSLTDE